MSLERELIGLQRALSRRWMARRMVRGLWLGLLVPVIGLAGRMWLGWTARPELYAAAGVVVFFLVALSALFSSRISPKTLARRVDRRLDLMDRVTTAVEVDRLAKPGDIGRRLVFEAEGSVRWLEDQIRQRPAKPWREMETLAVVGLALVGLVLTGRLDSSLPGAAALSLPPAGHEPLIPKPSPTATPPPDGQSSAPTPSNARGGGARPQDTRKALEDLGQALQDQASSHAAGQALSNGDTKGAAEALRRLADQVGQLSDDARNGLGQALSGAAEQTPAVPDLQRALRQAADALQSGDAQAAAQALQDLAGKIELLGQSLQEQANGQPLQQNGAGQGDGNSPAPGAAQGQNSGSGQANSASNSQPGKQGSGQDGQSIGAGSGRGGNEAATRAEGRTLAQRLPGGGEPMVLAAPSNSPDQATITQSGVLPSGPASSGSGGAVDGSTESPSAQAIRGGSDPLRYPWDLRDVVEGYFTPQ